MLFVFFCLVLVLSALSLRLRLFQSIFAVDDSVQWLMAQLLRQRSEATYRFVLNLVQVA